MDNAFLPIALEKNLKINIEYVSENTDKVAFTARLKFQRMVKTMKT